VRRIFICYRRADSAGLAGRIHDRLANRYGRHRVFMDAEAIPGGEDWVRELERAAGTSPAVLVIIGSGWLSAAAKDGSRRLDDPDDWVRREVAAGLGPERVTTIPILVDGAHMPHADELPPSLRRLSDHQPMRIDHETFETDVNGLLARLEEIAPVGPDRDLGQPVSVLDYHGRNPLSAADPDSRQMALSADGRRFAAVTYRSTTAQGEAGGWVAAWDVTTGTLVAEFSLAEGAASLALSPDGALVAIGTGGLPGVQLRELPTGKDVGRLVYWPIVRWALAVAPVVEVSAVAFNADARFLATACGLTARVWDVGRRRTVTRVSSPRKRPLSDVALDGPGTTLATADKGETRLWHVPDGRPLGHFPHGRRLAFSADGRRLATAGPDEQARVWDVVHGSQIASVRHDKEVADVALSPHGTYLATGSKDRTVCLWDVDNDGRELVRLGLDTPVRYVAITTGGRQMAAASDALRLWRVPPELAEE
jgi:hypothetical protein